MILAHGGAASTGGPEAFLPAVVLGLTAAAAGSYAVLARRQARRHGSWSGWRTVSFVTGAGLLGMALAVLSQLLYAGALVQVPVSAVELRGAGELMYYGGDIAELLLALAMLTTWRRPRAAGRRHLAAGRQATAQW